MDSRWLEHLETDPEAGHLSMAHLDGFPVSPAPPNNIVTKLALREIAIDSPPRAYHRRRALYQSIVPNYTEPHVKVPSGYLRKFSPNGNLLLGFSSDQKSIVIYDYLGAGRGHSLYREEQDKDNIRLDIFGQFFRLRHTVSIPHTCENLNRECSVFTEDGQYVIVGSSMVLEEPLPSLYDIYRNNESVSSNGRYQLEDYTLYIVDMQAGHISDLQTFKCDKIFLSHNQGLSLCESVLAVFALQQQTIHLYSVSNGTFVHMHDIGRFCYPDDPLVYSQVKYLTENGRPVKPYHEHWFNSLKHRLLCWHLRNAERCSTPKNSMPVLNIFQKFDVLANLKVWKVQLLSRKHMLLKFASEEVVTLKATDPMSQPALIAVYNIESTEFESVFENTSEELLRLYEDHADLFRVPISHPLSSDVSSVSNDKHARALHMKFKQTITNARYGGKTEATRRLLGQIPMCCQCHSSSPYLDSALFSYDDKWVSALERPKNVADTPVRYNS
jgi:de-etiolated-1